MLKPALALFAPVTARVEGVPLTARVEGVPVVPGFVASGAGPDDAAAEFQQQFLCNRYLKGIFGIAALSAARCKNT